MPSTNRGKEEAAKGVLADRGMTAIDPLGERLCAPESFCFNGLSRAEFPVQM
jgi:hypothetical protein